MRAVVFDEYGGPEVLRVAELPTPEPGPGQARIRVAAATVNPVDVATRSGAIAGMLPPGLRPPHVPGWDVAGTVTALGSGASGVVVGDVVLGMSYWFAAGVGMQAEEVVLDAGVLVAAPASASIEAGATLPLNGLTALQALDLLELGEGETLLVSGAAGAVGGYAVQLAARRGLRVLALASPGDADLVAALGATTLVRRSEDLVAATRALAPHGVDGVIDAAAVGPRLIGAVRDGGAFVAVIDPALPAPERGVRTTKVDVRGDGEQMADLVRLVDAGDLTLRVADVLGFDQAPEAHRGLEKGGLRGRLVLTP